MTPKQTAQQWASDLATIAKAKGITQKKLAELSKVHAMTINQGFKGKRVLSAETLAAIAEVLDVRLEWVEKSNTDTLKSIAGERLFSGELVFVTDEGKALKSIQSNENTP